MSHSDSKDASSSVLSSSSAEISQQTKHFIRRLGRELSSKRIGELLSLYHEYFKHSQDLYSKSSWPAIEDVKNLIENDDKIQQKDVLVLLYKELYYRHIYAALTPTIEDRFESFSNYIELFTFFLQCDDQTPECELPNAWLWDIIDEFVYQFQAFHAYRHKKKDLSKDEKEILKANSESVWHSPNVFAYLQAFVKKAKIDMKKKHLAEERQGTKEKEKTKEGVEEKEKEKLDEETNGNNELSTHLMFRNLGYFSLVALLRVNCLLCDYSSALKSLDPIDLRKNKSTFTPVLTCHVTLYFYLGFAYLMCRRYVDAIKIFSYFLTFIYRNKRTVNRSIHKRVIEKRIQQMYAFLAIASALAPQETIEENLLTEIRELYSEQYSLLLKGDMDAFTELFSKCCPKFVNPAPPNYEQEENTHGEYFTLQVRIFLAEVRSRLINLPTAEMNNIFKLFSAISISKFSQLLQSNSNNIPSNPSNVSDEDSAIALLLKYKHKNRNIRWVGGSPNEGKWIESSEVQFYVNNDVIHTTESAVVRRYGEYFVRQLNKLEDVNHSIRTLSERGSLEEIDAEESAGGADFGDGEMVRVRRAYGGGGRGGGRGRGRGRGNGRDGERGRREGGNDRRDRRDRNRGERSEGGRRERQGSERGEGEPQERRERAERGERNERGERRTGNRRPQAEDRE